MLISYVPKKFNAAHLTIIQQANEILDEYETDGLTLTLRQLYYQFVARGLIENTYRSYKNLGTIISDARLAGKIDWHAIEDRTRWMRRNSHWDDPAHILGAVASQYRVDMWDNQYYRPEIWIEKDALIGVIEKVCKELDVPYFACRGYASQSELWVAGRRMAEAIERGQTPYVIHLGDHDPSGIDMTRDNEARLTMFAESPIEVRRIALNYDQVQKYDPPPNPAKITDSRARDYIKKHGHESWELDALEPKVIIQMVRGEIEAILDEDRWEEAQERVRADKAILRELIAEAERKKKEKKDE